MENKKFPLVFVLSRVGKKSIENSNTKRSNHSNLIYVHFLFLYYLLLSPFRLKKAPNGKYETHSWFPQKILCGLNIIFANLGYLTWIRLRINNLRNDSAVSFLLLLATTCSFILRVVMHSGFWRKKEKYLNLANYLNSCSQILPYNPFKIESTKFLVLFHICYLLYASTRWILGVWTIHSWDWSPSWLYRRFFAQAQYTFFLADNPGSYSTAPNISSMTGSDHFVTGVFAMERLSFFIMIWFTHVHLLIHILSLCAPVTAFANSVYNKLGVVVGQQKIESKSEFDLVFHQFNALKDLSILLREAIGDLIPPFFAVIIFTYSMSFEMVVLVPDIAKRVAGIIDCSSAMCILILSAEIVRKMDWFKMWLLDQNKIENVDQHKLGILFESMTNQSVGVNAAGMFKVDYAFLGTVGGLAVTFFIIRLQAGAPSVF